MLDDKVVETSRVILDNGVELSFDDEGKPVIKVPEGTSDIEANKLLIQSKELINQLKTNKQKGFDLNREKEELKRLREELEQEKARLKNAPQSHDVDDTDDDYTKMLMKKLGCKNESELDDIEDNSPEKYKKAKRAVEADIVAKNTRKVVEEAKNSIKSNINDFDFEKEAISKNLDPGDVKTWLKSKQFPFNKDGIEYYIDKHPIQENKTLDIIEKIRSEEVKIIKSNSAGGSGNNPFAGLTDEQIYNLPDNDPRLKHLPAYLASKKNK